MCFAAPGLADHQQVTTQLPSQKPSHDERFNYEKDPISWFYQNQIKSEEQFQEKKAELRETARHKLDDIFEKKGKHLIIDSEDDDFSIASSELSAWDSDVHSIQTLASCANSWAEAAQFKAPAMVTLRVVLIVTMVSPRHERQDILLASWTCCRRTVCPWQILSFVTAAVALYVGVLAVSYRPADSCVRSRHNICCHDPHCHI